MRVGFIQRRRCEFRIPQLNEPMREGLLAGNVADGGQPHLLDQRSCTIWLARSTRPLACEIEAGISLMC